LQLLSRYPNLDSVIADLKAEGIRVMAYINPYLNVKGDIYQQNQNEKIWLTSEEDGGGTLIQDFGQFNVRLIIN
jgi:alpha-glucosidase (family GH31 glycosyl hydrolase)